MHYYVQQGLVPPASSPSPGARYGEGHLSRLNLMGLLQDQLLPLAEISKQRNGSRDEQVGALLAASEKERQSTTRKSALESIRSELAEGSAPEARLPMELQRVAHEGSGREGPSPVDQVVSWTNPRYTND